MTIGEIEQKAIASFESLGGRMAKPPTLLPLSIPLELSGEAVRARLISCNGPNGSEYVLRPDLTLAIAVEAVAGGTKLDAGTTRYSDRAYRLPTIVGEPLEFIQTGFETYSDPGAAAEDDAATLAAVLQCVADTGIRSAEIILGDLGLFSSVVNALGFDSEWATQVNNAFRHPDGIASWFDRLDREQENALSSVVAGLSDAETERIVEGIFETSGLQRIGSRGLAEIAEGLRMKAARVQGDQISKEHRTFLAAVYNLSGEPGSIPDQIRALASDIGLNLDVAIRAYAKRLDEIERLAPPFWSSAVFQAQFGRRFNYYDGFVFEVRHSSLTPLQPIAAGGRYDGLISSLAENVPVVGAIGGVVRPDRIFRVLSGEAGQ